MLVQARFFSCQPTLPSDPQSGSQSRPPMPLRMKETRVYWWIRSECYHNFTRLPKCCPLGYPGDSPHTVSSHSEAFINKAKFIITQRICFCFTLEKNKLFSHRTCCPLRPSPFLRPLWLQPHCLCLLSLWGWTYWFPSAEQQYSRIALGRTEQGIRLPSLTPGVSFISQPSQARSLCASRAVRVLKAYPCNHIRPY